MSLGLKILFDSYGTEFSKYFAQFSVIGELFCFQPLVLIHLKWHFGQNGFALETNEQLVKNVNGWEMLLQNNRTLRGGFV